MTSVPAQAHCVRIFTTERLGDRDNLEAVFDAFTAEKLEPTHAGEHEYSLTTFDLSAVMSMLQRRPTLSLARRKAPRYTATLRAQDAGLTCISVDVGATPAPRRIYDLGNRLAERFRCAYGVVHPDPEDGTDFRAAGRIELGWLRSYGPDGVAARTWYGTHMVSLIGEDRIRAAGLVTPLSWGGLRLDLVAEPWATDLATLKQRQAEAIAAIAPSQVLGDYSHPVLYKRGARWVPIPEETA